MRVCVCWERERERIKLCNLFQHFSFIFHALEILVQILKEQIMANQDLKHIFFKKKKKDPKHKHNLYVYTERGTHIRKYTEKEREILPPPVQLVCTSK